MQLGRRVLLSYNHPTLSLLHPTPDSITWNTLIVACSDSSSSPPPKVLSRFTRMLAHGVKPDYYTFPLLLHSLSLPFHNKSDPHLLLPAHLLHSHALRSGFSEDSFFHASLINAYSSSGRHDLAYHLFLHIPSPDPPTWNSIISSTINAGMLHSALSLFHHMPRPSVISWTCIIDGYSKFGRYKEALSLFSHMLRLSSAIPNSFTFSSVLSACARLGSLHLGLALHSHVLKRGMDITAVLGTSLVDMYAKCGSISASIQVFLNMRGKKDVMAWGAMLCAMAAHGLSEKCLALFEGMVLSGTRPNGVTFLGVLCACAHGGMTEEGEGYFKRMGVEFGLVPVIEHYGCMVDLYGKAGMIEEACCLIKSMPMEPDVVVWGALLSGCRTHGNVDVCEVALGRLIELEPWNSGAYVLLSNVYAGTERWTGARALREAMEKEGVKKEPGCSFIEVGGVGYEFFSGDESLGEVREMHSMLDEMVHDFVLLEMLGNEGKLVAIASG